MVHDARQHPNAVFDPDWSGPDGACVIQHGWTIEQTAERFQVDPKTVRKRRDRFLVEGPDGLLDRSSRPRNRLNRV